MASKSAQKSGTTVEEAEELLDYLDKHLDRLKTMYEQYFLGIQKQAPGVLHADIERRIRDLLQVQLRNTAHRYKFATLQQKFSSYNAYWRRTLRQIEQGTYFRNLSKIGRNAAKTGEAIPDEILAAMPKRMREQVVRDREVALAQLKRRGAKGEAAAAAAAAARGQAVALETPSEEVLELHGDDFLSEDGTEGGHVPDHNVATAAMMASSAPMELSEDAFADAIALIKEPTELRRNLKKHQGAHVVPENDGDLDLDQFFASVEAADDAPKMQPHPRPQSQSNVNFRAIKRLTAPPASAAPAPAPVAAAPIAAAPIARPTPTSMPVQTGTGVGPRPMAASRPTPTSMPIQNPSPSPSPSPSPKPLANPAAGSVPRFTPNPAATRPMGNIAPTLPSLSPPMPAPTPSTATGPVARPSPPISALPTIPARPGTNPAGVPTIPAIPAPPRAPSAQMPAQAAPPPARAPSAQMPAQTAATQTGPVPRQTPIPAKLGTQPGTQPVPRPTPMPRAATPVPVRPDRARTDADDPRPPQRVSPPPGMTEGDVNALYAKYVKAKEMVGENAGPGAYGKLLKTINAQAPKIMEQYKAKGVDFQIVVKDNQVIIRAKPK